MTVTKYVFESPYPNQVQVGRPDPSSKRQAVSDQQSMQLMQNSNQSQDKRQVIADSQNTKQDTPNVSKNLLDVYA